MKKKLLSIAIVLVLMISLTACSTLLGKWRILEISAGDITMKSEEIDNLGLDAGFVKINKSGSCVVNLLGDEYEGSWTQSDDGTITFSYGDSMTGTATVEDGTMTMTDAQGSVYMLEK